MTTTVLSRRCDGRILEGVTGVLFVAALVAFLVVVTATGGLRLRRYSGSHWVGHLVIAGRGLHFSRTPDGAWWRLRSGRVAADARTAADGENRHPTPGYESRVGR